MCVAAMERPLFHLIKQFGSLFHRPLVLRMVWWINNLLISFLFWLFVYWLHNR